ncbi:hypothetical protein R3W88_011465 [Solanum pinnatisectum]|uniref:Homeobox domain-containing protein n=1 Tax=Solanum pinnatisectum TaxID=50273 RepID=A0AAV9L7D0_9SOLN|nr:hypothetical protein R3W88_011465 [Solanum pinnatisectum]
MADFEKEHVGESPMCQKGLERERQCHSLTVAQIHQLEAFLNECSHPNENQRNQLGRKIGLDPKKIMIWYQNKMTQTETWMICPYCFQHSQTFCHSSVKGFLNHVNIEYHPKYCERSSVMGSNFAQQKSSLGSPSNLLRQKICGSLNAYHSTFHQKNNTNVREHPVNINNIPIISSSLQENYEFHHDNRDKSTIFEIGGCFIHREVHEKLFPNQHRPCKSPTTRFESSKVCGVVPMSAIELIQNFLDLISFWNIKWMNMFPTIVTKARTIELLDSGNVGGSMQLMYEKLHILSPLLEARDYFFIYYCRKLDQTTWIMVDVSHDLIKEIQSGEPSHAWKFPSGCAIRDTVTWIEHVQVDEKIQVHHTFRNLLIGFIVTASTSIWHPYSFQIVFKFLKDDNTRCQWDVLTSGNNVTELARINTGTILGNIITIIQMGLVTTFIVLKKSGIDEIGAFLIYAPIDSLTVNSIVNGVMPKNPVGRYPLCRDNNRNLQNGSILTISFQILIIGHPNDNSISQKEQKSEATSVHTLLSSIVLKIKTILDCSD